MWITIAVVILAMASVVGPILWIMPSKYQLKVAKMRQSALQHGLRVMMNDIPPRAYCDNGERRWIAVYYLPWSAREQDTAAAKQVRKISQQPWRLVYEKLDHELHFSEHWQWSEALVAPAPWQLALRGLLAALPPGVCAVENNRQGLAIYWNERGDEQNVAVIATLLHRLRDQVVDNN